MKQLIISAVALANMGVQVGGVQTAQSHEAAAREFRRCASCHQPPDLAFLTDRAWLDQVRRTAWMGHADNKAREAMIAFLKSGALQAPRVVSTTPSKAADRVGFITPGFDEGTLFLKSTASEHYRLEWAGKAGESGAAADRRRAVPAGEYALVGYRIIRRDAQGTTWFISATGSNLRRLTVQASEEQQASIDETIHLTGGAHPSEGRVEIHVMVAGIKGSGLSIYRDGRRIDIGYRLMDAQGKQLARGTLAYGWGGGAGASCKSAAESLRDATATLTLGSPPFTVEGPTTFKLERKRTLTNSIGMILVEVPAGDFLMGAPDADDLARKDEKPQHHVRIDQPFFLGAREVTVGQFRAFVEAAGYKTAAETDGKGASGYDAKRRGFEYESAKYSWQNPGYPQDDTHPVVNVNWHDANAFCAWLSKKEGRRYRLPTEAEWEYACRAGATTRFTRGDSPDVLKAIANLGDQSLAKKWDTATVKKYGLDPKVITFQPWDDGHAFTAPVGSLEPNPLGLYDMLGNAGEFCSDWYQADYYGQAPELNPKGPAQKRDGHVVRGGTFLNGTTLGRATSRIECRAHYRNYVIGFRVLLEGKHHSGR